MQATLPNRQARPRFNRRESLRQCTRQLIAVSGELLALASLTVALAAGLTVLAGVLQLAA
ncbi:hypothetical protein [Wenzhouxiangella sp. EGI_FJ10305]|uniref:hypothetical protein n=1 Tax=Wenzhouxiangella sp. EGI_FJ10305 TaxID=3243768 RepID=UPI0035D8D959